MCSDRTSELWLKIDQMHIKYLQAEETPAKLDIRKKLEGYVVEYLSLVPQDRKFVSATTGDIIFQSVRWIPDFSLVKAANAFRAIEQYAANLINQPWRPEFWNIKQYSGFYKHNVQSSLSGAETLFYDMGYRDVGGDCLELAPGAAGTSPVNNDLATSVARDCILACVECKILADIHSGVTRNFPVPLEEVLEFRRDHIGTVEKAVQELFFRRNQAQFQQGRISSPWEGHAPPAPGGYGLGYGGYGGPQGFIPPPYGYNPPIPSHIEQIKAAQAGPYLNGLPIQNGHLPPSTGTHSLPPNCYVPAVNGYIPDGGAANNLHTGLHPSNSLHGAGGGGLHSSNSLHVPTGRLVELEQDKSPPGSSTSTLRQGQIPTTVLDLGGGGETRRSDNNGDVRRGHHGRGGGAKVGREKHRESGEQIDSWDFVYKQLEQSGYTKDQAERPDVLRGRARGGDDTPTSTGLYVSTDEQETDEEVMRNMNKLRLNGLKPSQPDAGKGRRKDTSSSEQDASKYSSAVSQDKYSSARESQDRERMRTGATPQRAARGLGQVQQQRKTRQDSPGNWECGTCTFHNKPGSTICEMCGKTGGDTVIAGLVEKKTEDIKVVDEGLTCDKCTLVNQAGAKICDACGATLGVAYSPIRPARKNSWGPKKENSIAVKPKPTSTIKESLFETEFPPL